ncbi:MAG TPA: hypothetical protein VG898_11310 [Solirubrobacterales bacterium]|nr:hypothetical protein [Solirubrobacterales bacterium]
MGIALAIVIPIGAVMALQAVGSQPAAGERAALARLLRFRDLPLGYRLLNFGPSPEYRAQPLTCGAIDPANPQPGLADFLRHYSPTGCYAIYYRSFHVPGTKPAALAVGSGAMVTDSIEGAEAGLAIAPELLSHLLGDELPEEVEAGTTIGDATRLFHWQHPALFKASERPSASFLVWRSGAVVAAVFATDGTVDANDRAVRELAQLQQRRIEAPVPAKASEFDSSEVALEDPALDIPVLWLGRRFAPGHGLQQLRLRESASRSADESLAPRISLLYVGHPRHRHAEAIYLALWSRKQWKRLEAKRHKLPAVPTCPMAKPLKIPREHLVIYRGFEGGYRGCKHRAGRGAYTARIHLDGVVATAETSMICAVCASAGTGPYDSRAGMEAIARGLVHRRPAGR